MVINDSDLLLLSAGINVGVIIHNYMLSKERDMLKELLAKTCAIMHVVAHGDAQLEATDEGIKITRSNQHGNQASQ